MVHDSTSGADSPASDEHGSGMGQDQQQRMKLLEQQLQRAQKLESVGQLAGGLAHDFNNLLTAILAYAELAELALAAGQSPQPQLSEIRKIADQAGKLTLQLLTFTRTSERHAETLDPNEVVVAISRLLRRLIGEDVEIRYDLVDDAGLVHIDQARLTQLIINLAVNSRQAMPNGGQLVIATARAEAALDGQDAVRLTVKDTGVGIPPELHSKIFDPLFTTKGPERGTGLGLATVKDIVQEAGGRIQVTSEVGKGARFDILFPSVAPASTGKSTPSDAPYAAPPATILVVEDDAQVALVVRTILEEAGHRVLSARDGEQALALVEKGSSPIQVVLTDVVLPKMSGFDVVKRVRAYYPTSKALFSSGYGPEQRDEAIGFPNADFLPKPFSRSDLLERVGKLLG